jgi:HSP20 family molecular chaperone IbpA
MDRDSWLQPTLPTLHVYKNGSGELIIDVDLGQIVSGDLDLTAEGGLILIKGQWRDCETADGYLVSEILRTIPTVANRVPSPMPPGGKPSFE